MPLYLWLPGKLLKKYKTGLHSGTLCNPLANHANQSMPIYNAVREQYVNLSTCLQFGNNFQTLLLELKVEKTYSIQKSSHFTE